jgi:NAD(P)H dehydrogenase (quinone)
MILVTGANGHFGSAAIDFLLSKGIPANEIVGLVRSEEKGKALREKGVQLRSGDYTNYGSIEEALKGVDRILFVSSPSVTGRAAEHLNLVKAISDSQVKHIVYTSFIRKNETASSQLADFMQVHIATEQAIKATGIPYTIMRENCYADFIPWIIGEKVLETGIYYPAGDTKVNWAFRSEMAEVAANILTQEGHENKDYNISGVEPISFAGIANMLTMIIGKTVPYTSPGINEYIAQKTKDGMPEMFVGIFSRFGAATAEGEFLTGNTDMERLLGRKPASVEAFLKQVYTSTDHDPQLVD